MGSLNKTRRHETWQKKTRTSPRLVDRRGGLCLSCMFLESPSVSVDSDSVARFSMAHWRCSRILASEKPFNTDSSYSKNTVNHLVERGEMK